MPCLRAKRPCRRTSPCAGPVKSCTRPQVSAGFPRGDGRFSVNLYRLDVEIVGPDGNVLQAFQVERPGWTFGTSAYRLYSFAAGRRRLAPSTMGLGGSMAMLVFPANGVRV